MTFTIAGWAIVPLACVLLAAVLLMVAAREGDPWSTSGCGSAVIGLVLLVVAAGWTLGHYFA